MTEANPLVLVVDDEVQIRRFLRAGLELDGFMVQDAETGHDALRLATLKPPDLVILDLGLPDMDGSEVLERLRAWSSVPLIVLSVRSNEAEKVRLLEGGADDYVVKPFGMAELLARARVALRRHRRGPSTESVVNVDRLKIDFARRAVTLDGMRVWDVRAAAESRRSSPLTVQGLAGLARKEIDPRVRIALVRSSKDPFRVHDPEFVAAGGARLERFVIPLATHSMTTMLTAGPIISRAVRFLLDTTPRRN
jgi:CheY-like chemotaxis protein